MCSSTIVFIYIVWVSNIWDLRWDHVLWGLIQIPTVCKSERWSSILPAILLSMSFLQQPVVIHIQSSLDISELWGLFLQVRNIRSAKRITTTMIRFEKAFLIEIYYSKKQNFAWIRRTRIRDIDVRLNLLFVHDAWKNIFQIQSCALLNWIYFRSRCGTRKLKCHRFLTTFCYI